MTWQTYVICAICVVIGVVLLVGLYIQSQSIADTAASAVQDALAQTPEVGQAQRSVNVCVAGLLNLKSCNTEQSSTATTTDTVTGAGSLDLILFLLMVICITAPCAVFLSWLLGGSEVRL